MMYKAPRYKGVCGMEVNLYVFFTQAVDRNEWLASRHGRFTPWEWTVDNRWIGMNVTDWRPEMFGEGECLLVLSRITAPFLICPVSILVTLPTELFYSDACLKLRNSIFFFKWVTIKNGATCSVWCTSTNILVPITSITSGYTNAQVGFSALRNV